MPASLSFATIEERDTPALTKIMTAAFDHDARQHLGMNKGGPEGYDTGEFFRKWLFGQELTSGFTILSDGRIIGATIVWIYPHGDNFLGTLFIDPAHQDKGFGTRTWRFIETTYPCARTWSLTTPAPSTRNRYFYVSKCGFEEERIEDGFVHMRKIMHPGTGAHGSVGTRS